MRCPVSKHRCTDLPAKDTLQRAPGQNMSCCVLVMLASVTLLLVRSSMPVIVLPWPR